MQESATVQFKLNLPVSLKDRLSDAAERSGRSLTSEIITRLQATLSLADDNGLEFTYEAIEALIIKLIDMETVDLRRRVLELEFMVTDADQNLEK